MKLEREQTEIYFEAAAHIRLSMKRVARESIESAIKYLLHEDFHSLI